MWGARRTRVTSASTKATRSPEKGAESAVYLCSSAEVDNVSGEYFFNCKARPPKEFARNHEDARRLWEVSERMSGLVA